MDKTSIRPVYECALSGNSLMDPDIDQIIGQTRVSPVPPFIVAPYTYLHELPGNNQNMRYRFLVAFNKLYLFVEDERVFAEIGSAISILHDSSLLIDDIEDVSTVRRGQTCAHIKYGVPLTINAGNLMYFEALKRVSTSLPALWLQHNGNSNNLNVQIDVYTILVDEMVNLHVGQGLDIYWRDNLAKIWKNELPSVAEYLDMVMNKTGGLFRLSVRLLAFFSSGEFELSKLIALANLMGIIYQVRDDYLNLIDKRYLEMKGMAGEDLVEGKLSLPILHAMANAHGSTPVHELLLELTTEERLKHPEKVAAAITYLRECGSLAYTYNLLKSYEAKALAILAASSGDTGALKLIVEHLADVVKF